jgi:hypothetical protein
MTLHQVRGCLLDQRKILLGDVLLSDVCFTYPVKWFVNISTWERHRTFLITWFRSIFSPSSNFLDILVTVELPRELIDHVHAVWMSGIFWCMWDNTSSCTLAT